MDYAAERLQRYHGRVYKRVMTTCSVYLTAFSLRLSPR